MKVITVSGDATDLSFAQKEALRRLAELRLDPDRGDWSKPCRDSRTLGALQRLGFVEIRFRRGSLDFEGRITDKGLENVSVREIV